MCSDAKLGMSGVLPFNVVCVGSLVIIMLNKQKLGIFSV